MNRITCLVFLFFLLNVNVLIAQYDGGSLSTDRPGLTYTSLSLGKGIWQLESGLTFFNQKTGNASSNLSFGNINYLRYGLFEPFEVMLGVGFADNWTRIRGNNNNPQPVGLNVLEVALRYNLFVSDNGTSMGLLFNLFIPTLHSSEYQQAFNVPSLLLTFSTPFLKKFSLSSNVGMSWELNSQEEVFRFTLAPGFPIYKNLSGYLEWFGFVNSSFFDTGLDGGFSYLINNNLQVDLHGGFANFGGEEQYFINAGVAWRFGKRVKLNKKGS